MNQKMNNKRVVESVKIEFKKDLGSEEAIQVLKNIIKDFELLEWVKKQYRGEK